MTKTMKIFIISDTHGNHSDIDIPPCDVCIHLGDMCTDGNEDELTSGFQWLANAPAKKKLFIPGNHDWPFEFDPEAAYAQVPPGIIVLENRSIRIGVIQFFAPIARPVLFQLPENHPKTNILLTHAPPKGILDNGIGCHLLRKWVDLHKPNHHFFGHVHETFGEKMKKEGQVFWNVGGKGVLMEV